MKSLLKVISIIFSFFILICCEDNKRVFSPDGKIQFDLFFEEGDAFYTISMNDQKVLEMSPLGLLFKKKVLETPFKLSDYKSRRVVKNYQLTKCKKKDISYVANEVEYTVKDKNGNRVGLIVRVSNDGVAFAYKIFEEGTFELLGEKTGFKFPNDSRAFITPMSKAKTGWERTHPSYEEHYEVDVEIGITSKDGQGWTYPALFKTPDENWVLISESGVDRNYVATHLGETVLNNTYFVEFPHEGENMPDDPTSAVFDGPFVTPWKIIIIGETLKTIIESTLAQDVAEPLYDAKYDYKAGVASWSWLVLKDGSANYEESMRFIDLAAEMNFEYCLIDGWWDRLIGRDRMKEVVEYATSKGVGVLLWYNSNGTWNDAPQTPKDRMYPRENRIEEMQWMQSIGVKGIKVDFFGGDKQRVMELYDDILRDGNEYGLIVNFHGATLPRGWDVMYPNFVTSEAVLGMEFCTFHADVAEKQPWHCCVLPFTRNVVAQMDFTPMILNERLGDRITNGPVRKTSLAFELALPVIFQSGVQHVGLLPQNLEEFPGFVFDYLKMLPAAWDETIFIDGYPGKFVVMARKYKNIWFVAGINGEEESRDIRLDLSFIPEGVNGSLIIDNVSEWNTVVEKQINSNERNADIRLEANGGFVLTFKI